MNKIIHKHHALQADRRGKPILPSGQKNRVAGQRSAKGFVQQGKKRHQPKGPYTPIKEIRDPMEGKQVIDPSQLMDTTLEVLKQGKRCYRCFKEFTSGHQAECPGKGVLPHMKVNPAHGRNPHSLLVTAICSAERKWVHSLHGKTAVLPVNNRQTVAAMVPVPKIHMSKQPKGQKGKTSMAGQFDHADQSDRMFHKKHFDHVQTLVSHPFTLDACSNPDGKNILCERYCSL